MVSLDLRSYPDHPAGTRGEKYIKYNGTSDKGHSVLRIQYSGTSVKGHSIVRTQYKDKLYTKTRVFLPQLTAEQIS